MAEIILPVDYFHKQFSSEMFDRVLVRSWKYSLLRNNLGEGRGRVGVKSGWNILQNELHVGGGWNKRWVSIGSHKCFPCIDKALKRSLSYLRCLGLSSCSTFTKFLGEVVLLPKNHSINSLFSYNNPLYKSHKSQKTLKIS